jgi:TolB protein
MNYLRRLPLRPAALAALTALFTLGLAVPSLSPVASAQQLAPKGTAGPNGKIVFESDQSGDAGVNDVYTMDADGRHQTRLTTDAAHDGSPVWSPDGTKIAFTSTRRGVGFEIYLMNADGSNQRPLRADQPVYTTSPFEWSPDGTRLAYVNNADKNAYVIEAFEADGSDSTDAPWSLSDAKLTGSSDIEVSWSPDGSRLAVRNSQACGGCSDLYIVNADGSGRSQLTSAAGFETNARWSPDGSKIAYIGDRGTVGLYVINAAGGPEQLLSSSAWIGVLNWSPDGSRIAFGAFPSGINVINANGSGETPLTDLAGPSSSPFWSPDGKQVAFHNGGDIYVVSADGTSRRASNYTKTRRATEYASSWQRVVTP